ncbi:hypothetical protein QYE76_051915 [Lolium multiflorum]|uniref:Uncharacterized protein n=1 Tax=Lolium multiflorum TaxID=4521 RepID=A0AAD8SUB1_LOLMU|nr:hypothetical protein QYE76_051915 [Lolium multiflorum]
MAGRATLCSPRPFRLLSSRTPSSRKPKPREDLTKGYSRLCGAENTERKELSGGQESGEIPSRRGKSTPSPSSSSRTSSPSSSSSSPPSTPPSPPLHLVIAVAIQQHLENSESEAFRKERDELEEIFLRQPILKHDLPVEDLGTTPPPKEDPVFDLKPLPDNLKYAHIDDKKIYPVIISSKLSEVEEERLENIAYDPVPVNDSFPNEQLAVIKNYKIEKLKLKEILMKREESITTIAKE